MTRSELDYYRGRLDELAGETLRLDYEISGLRKEVRQKRQAFTLLSRLQQTIGAEKEISRVFVTVAREVNATLGMDKTVVLSPTDREGVYKPTHWTGFTEEGRGDEFAERMENTLVAFPSEVERGDGLLLVNKGTETTPLIEALRHAFECPYFVCVPVIVEATPIGLLLTGRTKEAGKIFPPMDRGDVETLRAIAGLVSASVENVRIGVLRETSRLKTEFFANISHEFRTPIALTLAPVEALLAGRYGELGESAREQLRLVQRNQRRLLALVNQILDLARLEAGALELEASPIPDANRLVQERVGSFAVLAEERGLGISTALDPRVRGADLYLDPDLVDQLLSNLLSNAVKFTARGAIEVSTELKADRFRLTVADTGCGIRAQELPHVFDRFRQAEGGEARAHGGTGIGLAWVKEIAELHGGTVSAHSELGKGTSISFDVPLGAAHLDPASVVEFAREDLPRFGLASRAFVVTESAADGQKVEPANRETETRLDPGRPTVLYAEDNGDLRRFVRDLLSDGYNVFVAADGDDGLEQARRRRPDLILVDQMMPNMSGTDLLRAVRADETLRATPVIFLSARAGADARIESLRAGADDYLTKPFHAQELLARVRNLLRARAQERELRELNRQLELRLEEQMAAVVRRGELRAVLPRAVAESVVSRSPRMQEVLELARRTARSSSTVLLRGETGTGKEVVARTIHDHSPYRKGPFVPVHCAALPASLLESELFGHEKGAFTGASSRRPGRFELAEGGTLFLDEVGELEPQIQVKLLRVLQERCFERVGGNRTIRVDLRLVASTNRDLEQAMREGRFREDLFYRLNVVPIALPALRERPEDIPLLVSHFLDRYSRRMGRSLPDVSAQAMKRLIGYPWPGNVRELQNLVERLVVVVTGPTLEVHDLPREIAAPAGAGGAAAGQAGDLTLDENERRHIRETLDGTGWQIRGPAGAAARLGVPESTLRYRMKKLGVVRDGGPGS